MHDQSAQLAFERANLAHGVVEGVQNERHRRAGRQTPAPDQFAVFIEVDGQVPFAAAEADLGDVRRPAPAGIGRDEGGTTDWPDNPASVAVPVGRFALGGECAAVIADPIRTTAFSATCASPVHHGPRPAQPGCGGSRSRDCS